MGSAAPSPSRRETQAHLAALWTACDLGRLPSRAPFPSLWNWIGHWGSGEHGVWEHLTRRGFAMATTPSSERVFPSEADGDSEIEGTSRHPGAKRVPSRCFRIWVGKGPRWNSPCSPPPGCAEQPTSPKPNPTSQVGRAALRMAPLAPPTLRLGRVRLGGPRARSGALPFGKGHQGRREGVTQAS